MLTDEDRRILRRLQDAPTLSMPDLGDVLGLSTQKVARRVEKMKEQGVIRATRAVIDWRALGYEVEVSLRFSLDKTQRTAFDEFIAAARAVPEVIEIQTFLGKVDVRLNVIARDMAHYQTLYRDAILALPHIADIEALMHVATVKSQDRLPI
ncbi:MAG: Lrp/AsnC family transcriptional regulator [Pseudomonadota bacterium]